MSGCLPARRDFDRLEPQMQARVLRKVNDLSDDPRPHGVVKLSGNGDLWRVRVGRCRVIYEITDTRLLVTVVKVALRDESTYRSR